MLLVAGVNALLMLLKLGGLDGLAVAAVVDALLVELVVKGV